MNWSIFIQIARISLVTFSENGHKQSMKKETETTVLLYTEYSTTIITFIDLYLEHTHVNIYRILFIFNDFYLSIDFEDTYFGCRPLMNFLLCNWRDSTTQRFNGFSSVMMHL